MSRGVEFAFAILMVFCLAGVLLVFVFYPFLVFLLSKMIPKPHLISSLDECYSVSILLAFYGDMNLLKKKISNFLELDYPEDKLEMIVCFDGPMPEEGDLTFAKHVKNLRMLSLGVRNGKTFALNKAATYARGELFLLTDADAIFPKDCLKKLTRHFHDPDIGGVFGKRRIQEKGEEIVTAQKLYVGMDSLIKLKESAFGSTTSNDGKIYMIRREYFEPIAPMTTDDLYCALRVIRKGKRFIFDPDVIAYIRKPSRSLRHEFTRRIRIVSQSMRSLWLNKEIFNPIRFGFFSVGLFINKVIRRVVGIFLFGILLSSFFLGVHNQWFMYLFGAQLIFYCGAIAEPLIRILGIQSRLLKPLCKASGVILYAITGLAGSIAGIVAFLCGRIPAKWEPIKG